MKPAKCFFMIGCLLLTALLFSCNSRVGSRPQEEKELREEIREDSSIQDPGGAKGVKEESSDAQKEQQDAVNELDQQ